MSAYLRTTSIMPSLYDNYLAGKDNSITDIEHSPNYTTFGLTHTHTRARACTHTHTYIYIYIYIYIFPSICLSLHHFYT